MAEVVTFANDTIICPVCGTDMVRDRMDDPDSPERHYDCQGCGISKTI